MGELIVYRSSQRPSVRSSVCPSTLSNIYISKTSRPNATKFYLKHHWGEGKAASGFGPYGYNAESGVIVISQLSLSDPFLTCR